MEKLNNSAGPVGDPTETPDDKHGVDRQLARTEGRSDMTSPTLSGRHGQTRLDKRDEELKEIFEQQERREMMEKYVLLARAKGQIRPR